MDFNFIIEKGISYGPKMSFYKLKKKHSQQCLYNIVGLKDLAKPSPFHIKPKAHAEKEETSEDE